ncbi:MAG: hypothetical protein FWC89_11310 [Defluviitaleaceae bacterium]|nr:hypothetical protein [Defluviitaleaceae bacterium]
MKVNKTVRGSEGQLSLFWEKILIAKSESYLIQVVTPPSVQSTGGLVGTPTCDVIILTLENITITNECRAKELVAAFRNGENPLFAFRGAINRPDGFFDEIILHQCASHDDFDIVGISKGFVTVWGFEAAINADELSKIMVA